MDNMEDVLGNYETLKEIVEAFDIKGTTCVISKLSPFLLKFLIQNGYRASSCDDGRWKVKKRK